jgi:hypothetical protein
MTRPRKATVDFFPHYCTHGKTMFVLDETYGIHGYYFWFRLLELLGASENHFIDVSNPSVWRFLLAKTKSDGDKAQDILNCLADMEAIDPDLWKSKIIWSQNFIDGIAAAYRNRLEDIPKRPDNLHQKPISNGINKTIKRKISADEPNLTEPNLDEPNKDSCASASPCESDKKSNGHDFETFWKAYPRKVAKPATLKTWNKIIRAKTFPGIEKILSAINRQSTWQQWATNGGKFIPFPSTWLNREGWNDEPPEIGSVSDRTYSNLKNAWEFANES